MAYLLRNGIIKIHDAQKARKTKGDKMQMLYNYLTSNEFRGQIGSHCKKGFIMKQSIAKERIQMEKNLERTGETTGKVLPAPAVCMAVLKVLPAPR